MIALLLAALLAWGQASTAGVSGPIPVGADPDAMTDALRRGKPAQREDLLRRLGVEPGVVRQAASSVQESGLRVEPLGGAEVLFVPCDFPLREAHLYLLRQEEGKWRETDDAALDCWWLPSSYERILVPGHPGPLVLAHHTNAAHGTGLVRDEMKLLDVRGSRWAPVLTTTEYQSEEITGADLRIEQTAALQPFPDGSLEETRATTRHRGSPERHALQVERRRWRWNAKTKAFAPGRFSPAL